MIGQMSRSKGHISKERFCMYHKEKMLNIKALALTISKLLARLIYRMIERRIERVTDGCKVSCSILLKKSLPSKSFFPKVL